MDSKMNRDKAEQKKLIAQKRDLDENKKFLQQSTLRSKKSMISAQKTQKMPTVKMFEDESDSFKSSSISSQVRPRINFKVENLEVPEKG